MIFFGVVDELEHSVEAKIAARLRTFVWFRLSVASQVLLQVATRSEPFCAEATLEGSAAGVSPLMDHEIGLITKSLTTDFHGRLSIIFII